MTSPSAFPLSWPVGVPRTKYRQNSPFRVDLDRAVRDLQDALRLFGTDTGSPVSGVVISSNVTLGRARPEDPGVAVYFEWDGASRCIAVDRFATVAGNVRAVFMILEGRRQELRYGGLTLVRASFAGFTALPAPSGPSWWEALGVAPSASLEEVEARFRELVKTAHPDTGGSAARMSELLAARAAARQAKAA